MKICVSLAIIVFGIFIIPFALADTGCPNIKGHKEIVWKKTEGPDFDICNAFMAEDRIGGVYLGNHPQLKPERTSNGKAGTVGKYNVKWLIEKSSSGSIAAETVFEPKLAPHVQYAHVWIGAKNDKELSKRLSLFEGLSFE